MDGNENTNFYDSWGLSDEDKGYLQSSKYADPAAVVKALRDTKAYVGADKNTLVRIPKPAADGTVDYSEVFKQLGRPDDVAGYGLADTDFAKAIAPKLLEAGITKKQAETLSAFLDEYNASFAEQQATNASNEREKQISNLKKEWGSDYELNTNLIGKAVQDTAKATGITAEDLNKIEDFLGVEKAAKLFLSIAKTGGGVKNLEGYNSGEETPEIAAYKLAELKKSGTIMKDGKVTPEAYKEIMRLTEIMNHKQ